MSPAIVTFSRLAPLRGWPSAGMALPVLWLSLVITALACSTTVAHAWGEHGHNVVCDIAWRELTPGAKQEVRRLVGQDPDYDTFAESCVWPDDIRGQRRYDWAKP